MFRSPQSQPQNKEASLLEKEQELARKIAEYQNRHLFQNEIPRLRAELGQVRTELEEVQFQRAIAESKASVLPPPKPQSPFDLESLQHKRQCLKDEIENYDYLMKQRETTEVERDIMAVFRMESMSALQSIEKVLRNTPQVAIKQAAEEVPEKKEVVAGLYKGLDYELSALQRKKQTLVEEIANYNFLMTEMTSDADKQSLKASRIGLEEELQLLERTIQTKLRSESLETSAVVVHPPLSLKEEKCEPLNIFDYIPTKRAIRATAVRTFSDDDIALIQQYIKEGQDLDDVVTRPLIEATILSNTMLEFTVAPYSLIPEGWTDYSLQYLEDHFKLARKNNTIYKDQYNKPHPPFVKTPNLDFPCTEDDILPCNTLLIASGLLLEKAKRWKNGDTSEPQIQPLKTYSVAERRKYASAAGLTATDVVILEKIYQSLPPSRQLMFNCILRDETHQIIETAVQLPDGYVYDESIPKKLLKLTTVHPAAGEFSAIHEYEGKCPRNPNITFKLVNGLKNGKEYEIYSEIKPVLYFGRVVNLLKEHAAKFCAKFKEQQAAGLAKMHLPNQAPNTPPLEDEAQRLNI